MTPNKNKSEKPQERRNGGPAKLSESSHKKTKSGTDATVYCMSGFCLHVSVAQIPAIPLPLAPTLIILGQCIQSRERWETK